MGVVVIEAWDGFAEYLPTPDTLLEGWGVGNLRAKQAQDCIT